MWDMGQAIAAFAGGGGAASAAMSPPQTPSNLDSLSTVSTRESRVDMFVSTENIPYVLVLSFFLASISSIHVPQIGSTADAIHLTCKWPAGGCKSASVSIDRVVVRIHTYTT